MVGALAQSPGAACQRKWSRFPARQRLAGSACAPRPRASRGWKNGEVYGVPLCSPQASCSARSGVCARMCECTHRARTRVEHFGAQTQMASAASSPRCRHRDGDLATASQSLLHRPDHEHPTQTGATRRKRTFLLFNPALACAATPRKRAPGGKPLCLPRAPQWPSRSRPSQLVPPSAHT